MGLKSAKMPIFGQNRGKSAKIASFWGQIAAKVIK
jgi:hypothetical protein